MTATGSGFVGIIIIMLVYASILILNTFIFYNYLVFYHMEGRLIDIYTRVSADETHFFIPFDNEVSARYLRWVIAKLRLENAAKGGSSISTKHAAITYHTVTNPEGDYRRDVTHISIYRRRNDNTIILSIGDDGKLVLYRHFVKTGDGAICELEEGIPFTVDEHPLLESWPKLERKNLATEESRLIRPAEEEKAGVGSLHTFKAEEDDYQGAFRLNMIPSEASPEQEQEQKTKDNNGEPALFLIKSE